MTRDASGRPLRQRADPAIRAIAAAMAAVLAFSALLMVLVGLDEASWAVAGVGSRSDALWGAAAFIALAAYGFVYAWKDERWFRELLGRAAWPTRRD